MRIDGLDRQIGTHQFVTLARQAVQTVEQHASTSPLGVEFRPDRMAIDGHRPAGQVYPFCQQGVGLGRIFRRRLGEMILLQVEGSDVGPRPFLVLPIGHRQLQERVPRLPPHVDKPGGIETRVEKGGKRVGRESAAQGDLAHPTEPSI